MTRRPAFLFYYRDWLSDNGTRKLTYYERGFYIDLLSHLFQEDGSLYAPEGLEDSDVQEMMNLEKSECDKILNKLIRLKCLQRTEDGFISNKRMVREIEIYNAKQRAGSEGGKKARANEKASREASKTQADAQAKSNIEASKTQADAQAKSNISVSVSDIYNKKNITQARAREGSSEDEKNGYTIEPPPGMPKTEEEAISMGALAGASESFVRDRAYPQALACGWMMDGNRTIRNFGVWAKLFEDNSKNAQKRKEVSDRKAVKPAKTLGERRMEAEPWLYDKDIKVREL